MVATKRGRILTYSEAGRVLGLDRQLVAALAARLGIEPKRVFWKAQAKGLDPADLDRIRRAWDGLHRVA